MDAGAAFLSGFRCLPSLAVMRPNPWCPRRPCRVVLAVVLCALAACQSGRLRDADEAREELLAADRAFCAAATAQRLEGWMASIAPDAVRLDLFGGLVQGRDAVRRRDAALFADPAMVLRWEPRGAALFDGDALGLTHGGWEMRLHDRVAARGAYVSLWRRNAEGRFELIFDTGADEPDPAAARRVRWNEERAAAWYAAQPWLVGCNFIPSTASNQLEMWQAASFDEATIDRELGFAAALGMNTVRTYLHDLAYETDKAGFLVRVDRFLAIAASHGIRPMLVFFDDCWNDDPRAGVQPQPRPGVHNSCWVRSPGSRATSDSAEWPRLENYVAAVIGRFADDPRVLAWDLYNEPGNSGMGLRSLPLLRAVFHWARAAGPSQPLTAGLWSRGGDFEVLNAFQLAQSDVVSFHDYEGPEHLRAQIVELARSGRPLLCTEWLRRGHSEVADCLPVFAETGVACLNWGLVRGRSNTVYPWGSAEGSPVPARWFHDLLEPDGTPHDTNELRILRELVHELRARGTR